jgi:hypothetical protein
MMPDPRVSQVWAGNGSPVGDYVKISAELLNGTLLYLTSLLLQ